MRVIAIANQRGGAAKTTTTVHLGAALAELGKTVLLIDMDPQGHVAEWFGHSSAVIEHEISEVLDNRRPLEDILLPVRSRLDLAPSNIRLSHFEVFLFNKLGRENKLKQALVPLLGRYDYILIDCPPSLGILTINALSAAQSVLIPIASEYGSMLGAGLLLQTIDEIKAEINPDLSILGILLTRYTRTVNAREIWERTKAELGETITIFTEAIPDTVKMREAFSLGKPVFEHDSDSSAAAAYRRFAKEVIGHG